MSPEPLDGRFMTTSNGFLGARSSSECSISTKLLLSGIRRPACSSFWTGLHRKAVRSWDQALRVAMPVRFLILK